MSVILEAAYSEEEDKILLRRYYSLIDPEEYLEDVHKSDQHIPYNSFFVNYDKVSMGISLDRGESEI